MKKRLVGFSLIIFLTFCFSQASLAQSVCATSLSDAQDNFDSGHLYGIPALLKPCLDDGFSDAEEILAYWLLARTYLIIDDPISAEDSYLKLLRLDPEYKVDVENDPIEIIHLSEKFKTTPIFTWTGKVGFNSSKANIINTYTTGNNNSSLASYSGELGYQVSSSVALNITDQWSLNGELMLAKRSFKYSNELFGADNQTLTENQWWIDLPLYIKYSRQYNKFHPYIYGGYAGQFLLSSNAEAELINVQSSDGVIPVTGPIVEMTKSRNRFTQSAIVGVGVKYRLKYSYLLFELRYTIGLKNLLKEDDQYSKEEDSYNSELLFRYGYVDSDFRINSTSVSFGYVHPFYKPRKIGAKPHFIQRLFRKKGGNKDED